MRVYVISCLISCAGCGFDGSRAIQYDKCFDLDIPIEIATPGLELPPLVSSVVPQLFAYYLNSLGGSASTTRTENPRIYVFNAEKYENLCGNSELGYIQNNQPTIIYMCKASYSRIDWLTYMVAHELGHVLGAGHTTCSDHTIMSPLFDCVPQGGLEYYDLDIAAICNSGHVTGGICGTRNCKER